MDTIQTLVSIERETPLDTLKTSTTLDFTQIYNIQINNIKINTASIMLKI